MRVSSFRDRSANDDAELAFAIETKVAERSRVRPRVIGSSSSMISIARIFGAPVTLPPGSTSERREMGYVGAQSSFHGRDEMLHLG
jgi:hypothetical protein